MISEKELIAKSKTFDHIDLSAMEKDEANNVLVFAASFDTHTKPHENMSPGHMEINRKLWNQQSPERPADYWVLGSRKNQNGIMTSIFASEHWLDNTPKDETNAKRKAWGV